MRKASNAARLTGLSLLGALATLVAGVRNYPSFDARSEYFPLSINSLLDSQDQFAAALAFLPITGILLAAAGAASIMAFSWNGARNPIPGGLLIASGVGFLISAVLGLQGFRILATASSLSAAEGHAHAETAYPWLTGSQTFLLMVGLGFLALGLLVLSLSMLRAGAFTRRSIAAALTLPAVLWLIIALAVDGAPLVWLVPGLPVAVWSVGLGLFLIVTGRITASGSSAAVQREPDANTAP